MAINNNNKNTSFLFPQTNSTILPDPSKFFSQNLLSTPLPTNSFFQNFVLNNGDQPEYIHPYLIKSSNSSLSVSYPFPFFNFFAKSQDFCPDLTITSSSKSSNEKHIISSYSDLSVTLDIPSSNLRFFLVRGSPFLTFSVTQPTPLSITTTHLIHSFTSNDSLTKYTFNLRNSQTWILYASSPITIRKVPNDTSDVFCYHIDEITSEPFSGIIRIAMLPDLKNEAVLDKFSSCYPVSGDAVFTRPFCVEYKWLKRGSGDLLMLAHPFHLKILCDIIDRDATILSDFKYESKDGDLVGVVADSWFLKIDPVSVTWHSSNGVKKEYHKEIVSALLKDVEKLNSSEITKTLSYYDGALIARAARLALIAEEVGFLDVIPKVGKFLKDTIEPWLDGTFNENGFFYDKKFGGIVTKQGCMFYCNECLHSGICNAEINHLGYFLYGIAVLVKLDPDWGRKYKPQAYSLMEDFMNSSTSLNPNYTRLRCFDLYKLHSWAGELTKFSDGRYRKGSVDAINAYYSATLIGLAYGDADVISIGSTLTALEILAAKRDVTLWYYSRHASKTCFRILPLLPISEVLFSDVGYVKDLVEWGVPAFLGSGRLEEGWKGFLCALKGQYDKDNSMKKIRKFSFSDVENSFSNLLWWIHSRG
ncbi:unnamed protein product [Trifolium pratense]|uniref:Uncharacterized protein n=1 Tax=Trifolium pratense TaxID=57577 RepID=A0ACB0LFC4_TRIPR|nr:unnamed protein product [Trifolium pratense]